MSELHERLYPEDNDQPSWELVFEDEVYKLTWDNTWLRYYRTGTPDFDEGLARFDHVFHKFDEDDEGNGICKVWTIDSIEPECLSFLLQNGYRYREDPIPERYILDIVAQDEATLMPEAIGPDFAEPIKPKSELN